VTDFFFDIQLNEMTDFDQVILVCSYFILKGKIKAPIFTVFNEIRENQNDPCQYKS
jgi:hypothetical protein